MHLSDGMRTELERRLKELEAESSEESAARNLPAADAWLLGLCLLVALIAAAVQRLA